MKCAAVNEGGSPFISTSLIVAAVYIESPSWFRGVRTSPPGLASQKQQSHVNII